eukprot:TRINITY_DN2493_c0_g2_i1.p1 TRINITY_DN2493_c0_g2~~TRINITY_DN2493_c0_g2_i1.p1  ORF type:complete len:432 (+),score=79.21 TRINITY_DN2493_c0_g2_i1:475-1770(+)
MDSVPILPPGMPLFNPAHNTADYKLLNEALADENVGDDETFRNSDVFWEMLGYQIHFDSRARANPLAEILAPVTRKIITVNQNWLAAFIKAWKRKYPVTLQVVDSVTSEVVLRFRVVLPFLNFLVCELHNDFSGVLLLRKEGAEEDVDTPGLNIRFSRASWTRVTAKWNHLYKCTAENINNDLNEIKNMINAECLKETLEVVLTRNMNEPLGLIFNAHDLTLDEVAPLSPAARCGATRLVGRVLDSVDGRKVITEQDVVHFSQGKTSMRMVFRTPVVYDANGLVEQCKGCKLLEDRITSMERKVQEVFGIENEMVIGNERQTCPSCSLGEIMPWAEICPTCQSPLREASPSPVSSWPTTICLSCSTPLRLPSTALGHTSTITCPRCRATNTCVLPPSPSPRRLRPSTKPLTCKACTIPLHGAFCHVCGQKV